MALNDLARSYSAQGRYLEAEALYGRAITIAEKQLGLAHPHLATSLDNLALLYLAERRLGEAEPLFKRSLAIMENAFGLEHPSVAIALNNLAGSMENRAVLGGEPLHNLLSASMKKRSGLPTLL